MGRELQKAYGQAAQVVVTLPLLEGTDGVQKMSKSLGNAIGVADAPEEMFGKLMSISDAMMLRYYELLTSERVDVLRRQMESGELHPMEAKKRLAQQMVARFSDGAEAQRQRDAFERRFQRHELPQDVPTYEWPEVPTSVLLLPHVMVTAGLVSSTSEARRLIRQGAVRLNGERIQDVAQAITPAPQPLLIQVGPRRLVSVRFNVIE